MELINSHNNTVFYNEYCLVLENGTKVYKYVPQCGSCNEEVYYTDEFGNKIDGVNETNATTCDEVCCEFEIRTDRTGIGNPSLFNNFVFGNIIGANWTEFVTNFESFGGIVQQICISPPRCHISRIRLCGISAKDLQYADENGNIQIINTSCSKPCCRQEQVIERCTCIKGIKQTIQLGIYTDTGEEIGWYIDSSTGESIERPTFVDCSCNFEC